MPKPSVPDPLKSAHITGQNPATPERLPGHTRYYSESGSDTGAGVGEDLTGKPAFLYRSGDVSAVTLDASGQNLPGNTGPWQLDSYFTLGARDAAMADATAEEMMHGIRSQGYFIWRSSDRSSKAGSKRR